MKLTNKTKMMTGLLLGGMALPAIACGPYVTEDQLTQLSILQQSGRTVQWITTEAAEVPIKEEVAEARKPAHDEPAAGQAKVQLAILLDTSSSMDGLIEQTKTQLWRIVNTFIEAKQNGQVPFVEVALYEYGNDGLNSETHWIRQVSPLTRDLDLISKELFALRTNGGSEFCGAVVQRATLDLKWDKSPDVYKAIFVAGNEPFNQGPIDPKEACRKSVAEGIIINTIHCGDEASGISGGWKEGAMLADGKFLIIDQNSAVVHIEAPQDAEIVKLNEELNKTYIAYGAHGKGRLMEQAAQDSNALSKEEAGAAVQRAVSKSSVNYHNSSWDLVDATKEKDFDWAKVQKEDLPEEMRGLDAEGRKKYVAERQAKRDEIARKIQELNKQREDFVAKKLKEMGDEGADTLDKVMVRTVRDQAAKKGYEFGK